MMMITIISMIMIIIILFTFLFERCNIPLAISRAIRTLSLTSKFISRTGFATLIYGCSLLFCRWFNRQPFWARLTTTSTGSECEENFKRKVKTVTPNTSKLQYFKSQIQNRILKLILQNTAVSSIKKRAGPFFKGKQWIEGRLLTFSSRGLNYFGR